MFEFDISSVSDVQESRLDDIETIQPNDSVSELVCSQEDIIISSYNDFKTCFSRARYAGDSTQ